jgi:hypothetical protein
VAQLKTYLMQLQEQAMTDAEMEDYLDHLYQEWLMQHEAYSYEDNYNVNTMEKARGDKNG